MPTINRIRTVNGKNVTVQENVSVRDMSAAEYEQWITSSPEEQKKIDEPQEKLRAEGKTQFVYQNGVLVAANAAPASGKPE